MTEPSFSLHSTPSHQLPDQLESPVHNQLLFSWAKEFKQSPAVQLSPAVVNLLSRLTTLTFENDRSFPINEFILLENLPLVSLTEVTIANCSPKASPAPLEFDQTKSHLEQLQLSLRLHARGAWSTLFKSIATCPHFNNLTTLTLSGLDFESLSPLFSGPNTFPNLTKLTANQVSPPIPSQKPLTSSPHMSRPAITDIRVSKPTDSDRVIEIWRLAVDATHDFLLPEDRQSLDAIICDFLPQVPLWLAVDENDKPLGFMFLHEGHMEALFIDPAYRGQGVGAKLVQLGLALHPSLTTDVNEQNAQAVGFYEKMGFQRTGRSELDGQGRPYPLIHLKYHQD